MSRLPAIQPQAATGKAKELLDAVQAELKTGLSDLEIQEAREARSAWPRNAAALQFARELVAKRGRATEADVEALRRARFVGW